MPNDDLDVDVEEFDPIGDYEKNILQSERRISLKPEYIEHLGIDEGDTVIVLCKENSIQVFSDFAKFKEAKDGL